MVFFVRARIDLEKMNELGRKLQNGELDRSLIKTIYCLQSEPSIGLSFWEADSRESFEEVFRTHREFYRETEVEPVLTSMEAQQILIRQMQK